uniref:Uncharacterized protein n=1 Tax=Utricularia reniformis TaxID=192314 RepID=A0A1Y0B4P2_9LAMI|nr:hypothetical protein AEK19_MT2208 [Utricularia reniformis]ART32354.1 hypothetical protein AEK19_MT2208 [Utricularia reniformis]
MKLRSINRRKALENDAVVSVSVTDASTSGDRGRSDDRLKSVLTHPKAIAFDTENRDK